MVLIAILMHNIINTSSVINTQLSSVVNRIYEVVASVSALVIGLLWIPIAISFFSGDEDRRYDAKIRARNALIGTLIYVLAMSGTLYAIFNFVVSGT